MVEQETHGSSGSSASDNQNNQTKMKVYELAKELGLDSISLLDKLSGLNIKVKNHMSELGADQISTARASLGKKPATAASSTTGKKVVARKKKTESDEAATSAPAKTAQKATKTKAKEVEAPVATEASEKKSASPIIRRRTKADGATETIMPPQSMKPVPESDSGQTDYETQATEPTEELHQNAEEAYEAGSQEASAASSSESEETAAAPLASAPGESTETSSSPESSTSPAQPGSTPVTAAPTRAPIVFPARPKAPQRSILKIVEVTAPAPRPVIKPAPVIQPKGAVKGTQTQDKDGFRIIKMTKENLDQMVEEEAAKKRGVGREAEIRPEDVRFADYRKKEMVFLPKRKKLPVGKELKKTAKTTPSAAKRVVEMQGDTISVQELANQLSVKATDVIRKLMQMGTMASINQALDFDTATVIANEYKYEVKNFGFKEDAFIESTVNDAPETLQPRPPIVTIMGHVDHGKTTLLDAIREANVAGGEAGGITQHIGAYTVSKGGKLISFIDTPGHEAFTVMRARGANVTDIVILVVAADDGVMPQTREALSHAQAAKVPIIVAVNKIDKPGANPEKIKQGLAELNLLADDWGGQTMFVPVSALKKTNLDKLLEAILLEAEVLDLKANPQARATGTVLEARLEKGKGAVVSLLVSRGTLRVGDAIVSGHYSGRVRAMIDDKGRTVKELKPGLAAEIQGFEGVPNAGERFDSPPSENDARAIAEHRLNKDKAAAQASGTKASLEDLFAKIKTGSLKELNLILKADVFGSVEAIRDSLVKLSNDQVTVKVIHAAPGGITESDVLLATASNAIIIGFNVRPETKARQVAEAEHVEIKSYQIIYELIDDVRKSMTGLLDKKKVEKFLGRAEVRQTFSVPKIGTIAGSSVIDGKIVRGANVRLLRESRIIYEGKMSSLKRFKDDAKEVATGFECGIGLENYNDLKPGDLIEAYQIEMIATELNA